MKAIFHRSFYFRLYNIYKFNEAGMVKFLLLLIWWPMEQLWGQALEIKAGAGFFTGASLRASQGRFIFGNGVCYSAGISSTVQKIKDQRNIRFELQYQYVSSPLSFERSGARHKIDLGNMDMHTLVAGAGKNFGSRRVQPYGMAMLGATFFLPDSLEEVERWTFTFAFAAGLKIAITPAFGINMQVLASLPLMYNRVYVGWEPNGSVATEVAPAGVLFSGYFTGGIYYNLIE